MDNRKTYWILSLSVLLSLSLILPYCWHSDISEVFFHQKEMAAHSMHGEHSNADDTGSCDCGHEFVKDFQKTKKVVTGSNTRLLLTGISTQKFTIQFFDQLALHLKVVQPGILIDTGPPIHVLNSVFLN